MCTCVAAQTLIVFVTLAHIFGRPKRFTADEQSDEVLQKLFPTSAAPIEISFVRVSFEGFKMSFWSLPGEDVASHLQTKRGARKTIFLNVWVVNFQHSEIDIQVKTKLYRRVRLERRTKISFVTPIQCTAWT